MLAGGPVSDEFLAEFRKSLLSAEVTMESLRGSEFVVKALQRGIADAGFAQADAVYAAYRTSLGGQNEPLGQLRGIAVSESANVYLVVRRDSPYRSVADLKHRRIGIFPDSTHAVIYARLILSAYGIDAKTAELRALRNDEMAAGLQNGSLDAATFGGPAISELVRSTNAAVGLRILDLGGDVVSRLRGSYPFFNPVSVRARDLPGQDGDVQTLGVDTLLVCRQNLPDERAYQLTRAFFEGSERLARATPALSGVDADLAAATPIPLHPGAARYYREREVLQ